MKRLLFCLLLLAGTASGQAKYYQTLSVTNWSDLSSQTPTEGQIAYSTDCKQYAIFNGSNWIAEKAVGVGTNTATSSLSSTNTNLAPALAMGAGAGTGATATITGNNESGYINFNQGTGGLANGEILVMTLAKGISYPNKIIITFTPENDNFSTVWPYLVCSTDGRTVRLRFRGLALGLGLTFMGQYKISGY